MTKKIMTKKNTLVLGSMAFTLLACQTGAVVDTSYAKNTSGEVLYDRYGVPLVTPPWKVPINGLHFSDELSYAVSGSENAERTIAQINHDEPRVFNSTAEFVEYMKEHGVNVEQQAVEAWLSAVDKISQNPEVSSKVDRFGQVLGFNTNINSAQTVFVVKSENTVHFRVGEADTVTDVDSFVFYVRGGEDTGDVTTGNNNRIVFTYNNELNLWFVRTADKDGNVVYFPIPEKYKALVNSLGTVHQWDPSVKMVILGFMPAQIGEEESTMVESTAIKVFNRMLNPSPYFYLNPELVPDNLANHDENGIGIVFEDQYDLDGDTVNVYHYKSDLTQYSGVQGALQFLREIHQYSLESVFSRDDLYSAQNLIDQIMDLMLLFSDGANWPANFPQSFANEKDVFGRSLEDILAYTKDNNNNVDSDNHRDEVLLNNGSYRVNYVGDNEQEAIQRFLEANFGMDGNATLLYRRVRNNNGEVVEEVFVPIGPNDGIWFPIGIVASEDNQAGLGYWTLTSVNIPNSLGGYSDALDSELFAKADAEYATLPRFPRLERLD